MSTRRNLLLLPLTIQQLRLERVGGDKVHDVVVVLVV
jgi:hypothetical protein